MNPAVDFFFNKATPWQEAYSLLRNLVLDSKLTEEVKWGCPCYTHEGKNVVLIHGFKNYCALLFLKGALMKDSGNIPDPTDTAGTVGTPGPVQQRGAGPHHAYHLKGLYQTGDRTRKSRR